MVYMSGTTCVKCAVPSASVCAVSVVPSCRCMVTVLPDTDVVALSPVGSASCTFTFIAWLTSS